MEAWNNSEHELLFLQRVPNSMVVGYCTLSDERIVGKSADCVEGSTLLVSTAEPVS